LKEDVIFIVLICK